jgi:hypothetical protein
MKRSFFSAACAAGVLLFVSLNVAMAQTQAASQRIAGAANAFLATLDASQRQKVLAAFDDAEQRKRWSNLPIAMAPRGGISLREMTPDQRTAALGLLSSVLSRAGYEKVLLIMEGDEANKGEARGSRAELFGKDLYFISILGTPSEKDPWMLQFGGHHLGVNVIVAGERGVLTPTLTGAQPAMFTLNGETVRPLKGESDKALALLNALDDKQRGEAILKYRVADLVLGPGQDGKTIQPEGLKASSMHTRQRAMLLDVMSEWAGIIHESAATARMAELERGLADTWFAWSGPTTAGTGGNITAYYRIQGPNVVIEYAPQQFGGDPALHIHAMYRDPTNDYGKRLVAK